MFHRLVGLILVSLMAATLSYGASQAGPVAQHATKYLGSLTYDPVDIIRVQGKPPKPQKPVAKPKPIAKPKAVAPRATPKPIASASGRTRSASSLPSRAKNLKWTAPSRATLQRPAVSAGARKLNASTAKLRGAIVRPYNAGLANSARTKLQADRSALKGGQSRIPRSLNEKILLRKIWAEPGAARALKGLNNDPRFPASQGWQKMQMSIRAIDRKIIGDNGTKVIYRRPEVAHYQYNLKTKQVADIKFVGKK